MTARFDAVTEVFEDLLTSLAWEVDIARAVAELVELLETPWVAYSTHPTRQRSALTESGAPFELSLKIELDGHLSLRYVVDVADPALDLIANAESYLAAARLTTRQPDDVLRRLFFCHVGDAPRGIAPTVMHGVGWSREGRRRGSLYFPAGWLAPDALAVRLPRATVLPGRAQVVGYDFHAEGLACWKTYHWLPVDPTMPLADRAYLDRLPIAAGVVYERFAAAVPEVERGTSAFLQRRVDVAGVQDRLFFFSRSWGWSRAWAMADLLGLLSSQGFDLAPLQLVSQCTQSHGLPVHVGLISVGGYDAASVTFYFWPV